MMQHRVMDAEFRAGALLVSRCCAVLLFLSLVSTLSADSQSGVYERAETLVHNHQWEDAGTILAGLLKEQPRNVKALNLAGLALIGKGDLQAANLYFRRSLAIAPNFVPALKNLGLNEFNNAQYGLAERHLQAAERLAPRDPAIHLYLGEIAYREGRYAASAREFETVPELTQNHAQARLHLAIDLLRNHASEKAYPILDTLAANAMPAQDAFALVIALQQADAAERALPYLLSLQASYPDSYNIGFDLILSSLDAKKFSTAIETAKELISSGHETAELDNLLAQAYEGNGEMQPAFVSYLRAIQLDPEDEQNYLDLATLYLSQRSFQKGLEVTEVALQKHPDSERLLFVHGLLHASLDDFEAAEKEFARAEKLSPQLNLGGIGLGASYLQTGHEREAILVVRQHLRTNPTDASLLYLLGESLLRTGAAPGSANYREAENALEKSTQLNPHLCLPHISLGTIYLDEKRYQDAIAEFEQARKIDPGERSAYSHLASAYRAAGNTGKAKDVLSGLKDLISQERASRQGFSKSLTKEQAALQTAQPASANSTAP